jgi:DNA-binding CsgD family transcriptional regulator
MQVSGRASEKRTPKFVSDTDRQRTSPPVTWGSVEAIDREIGLLLTDLNHRPIYRNSAAVHILCYPHDSAKTNHSETLVQERVRSLLQADSAGSQPADFLSGRRRYLCRSFFLSREGGASPQLVALLLERPCRDLTQLCDIGGRFHLSLRERETVQHLSRGLTTKEVAQRMGISPNTVKQFLRLIMSKMGVSTRSGIVGKLIRG